MRSLRGEFSEQSLKNLNRTQGAMTALTMTPPRRLITQIHGAIMVPFPALVLKAG
jgi:hypothetical protein